MSSPRFLSKNSAFTHSEVKRTQDLTTIDQDSPDLPYSPENEDNSWDIIGQSSTTEEKSDLENEEYVFVSTLPEALNAQTTTQTPYGNKIIYNLKKGGLIVAAALPPAALAVNAFCALPHIKTEDLSLDKIKELSSGMLALCIANGVSSYSINTILNLNTIPNAFQMFYDRMWVHFRKHPIKNTSVLLLAAGAGVSAAAVGYSSFLPLGKTLAWTNFGTNGFIFFVTRFYGLVNALNRFEKWYSHRYSASPLAYSFEDMLSHLTDDCAHYLEAFIKNNSTTVDEEAVTKVLKELDEILQRDSTALKKRTNSEILAILFDLSLAVGASISVLPVFAQKFLNGLDKLKALFTNEDNSSTFNELSNGMKWLLSSLSIATSVLYAGQASLLRQTLVNAYDSIVDPKQTQSKKIAKGFGAGGLFLGNLMACTSLYNLAETASKEPNYIAADFTPVDSTLAKVNAYASAVDGFAVNTKLTVEKSLPPSNASSNPIIERVQSSADLPALERQKSETSPDLPVIGEETDVESIASNSMSNNAFTPSDSFDSSVSTSSSIVPSKSPKQTNAQLLEVTKWLKTNTLSKESLHKLYDHHATLFGKKADCIESVGKKDDPIESDSLKQGLLS